MTESKNKRGNRGSKKTPKRVRPGVAVNVYIDPDIAAGVETYLAGLDPQITKTALIESLFKGLLRDKGLWPPKKSDT